MQGRLLHIYVCLIQGGCKLLSMRQMSFVKTTSSIGCADRESNAPVDFNSGEPTRPCTSGTDCFGSEDVTSVEFSTGEHSRPSCAAQLCRYFCIPRADNMIGIAVLLTEQWKASKSRIRYRAHCVSQSMF